MATTDRIDGWLEEASHQLNGWAERPALEAQVILAHVLGRPRTWVIAYPEFSITSEQKEQLQRLVQKRRQGVPLPYLIGHWEFFGLDFIVNPAVLIPRPETELLVEEALHWIERQKNPLHVIDLGTGSGCIAISLAKNTPGLRILAADISRPALETCQKNVLLHEVQGQVRLVQADLLEPFHGLFDLICANLPYIPSDGLKGLEVSQHEPVIALDGGVDGLRQVERLLEQASTRLAPDGLILLEIEAGEGDSAAMLAHQRIPGAVITMLVDLAGLPRLLRIEGCGQPQAG